ncbi:MAG: zinc ribbon domain-containing protein, partial [Candidatus Glassbacteria bacterium]
KCASCGWELTRPEQFALGDVNSLYCVECTNSDGSLKTFQEVHELITADMVRSQRIDRTEAGKMAEELMLRLPAWAGRRPGTS